MAQSLELLISKIQPGQGENLNLPTEIGSGGNATLGFRSFKLRYPCYIGFYLEVPIYRTCVRPLLECCVEKRREREEKEREEGSTGTRQPEPGSGGGTMEMGHKFSITPGEHGIMRAHTATAGLISHSAAQLGRELIAH